MIAPAEPAASPEEDVFVFPATAAQRRFWTLDGMFPGGNPALNMPIALRLNGPLDHPALERALQEIIARHEALRTTFHLEGGQLSQVIAPALTLAVTRVDLEDFPEGQRARVPDHLIREEAERTFDLARGPLVRARLVRTSGVEHLLLLTLHHIVCDGWSNGLILRELSALYGAFAAGKPSPLAELPLQFADYADWQHQALARHALEPHFAYWRRQLAGDLPALGLPHDHPRLPGGGKPAGAIRWRPIPAALARDLKTLATREGASAYMVYLAACNALLHRVCAGRPEDVVVSSPSANRQRAELEGLVGLFVNPLLLRTDLTGNPTFRELLGRVRQTALDAFRHADAPFEWVIEEIAPRRLPVSFLHQAAFLQPSRAAELTFTPLRSASGGAVFEWTLGAIEDPEGVRLCLEYNAALFDQATIDRTLEQYQTVLEEAAAAPEMRLAEFSVAAPASRAEAPAAPARGQGTPYLTLHFQMIELWQDLLGVSPIGIHDDFFALGGNSLLALRMLTRLEAVCGKTVPPVALFQNATIEGLANALLTGEGSTAPAILAVQPAGPKTPLFYLHGDLTGGGYYTLRLSRGLGAEQPFYTLPPVDVNALPGRPSIEEMAARHVAAIRSVRPQGPYALGGFCIGGLIAFEVAQQLRAAGEAVERLIIIDATVANTRFKRLRRLAESLGRRRGLDADGQLYLFCRWHFLLARLKRWRGLGAREQGAIAWRRLRGGLRRALGGAAPAPEAVLPPTPAAGNNTSTGWYDPRWDAPLVFLWATGGYQARPYAGEVTLLLSRDLAEGPEHDPAEDWKRCAPKLLVRHLPGSHLACITEHVESLAAAVGESLW